jgi:anti-sigma B factor antagonist
MASDPLVIDFLEGEKQGVLRLKGPLTVTNSGLFENAIRREQAGTVIFDLTNVPYVDSAGLGCLLSAYISYQKAGRRVALTGVNERVLKLFEITRVDSVFLMFPTLWEGIEALTGAAQA